MRTPTPRFDFHVTPDVETLAHRYAGALEGREPLPSAAYACLTLVEGTLGGKPRAATALNVSMNVLETLGKLASRKGDARTARKLDQPLTPLTGAEEEWLKAVLRHLIVRMGSSQGIRVARTDARRPSTAQLGDSRFTVTVSPSETPTTPPAMTSATAVEARRARTRAFSE